MMTDTPSHRHADTLIATGILTTGYQILCSKISATFDKFWFSKKKLRSSEVTFHNSSIVLFTREVGDPSVDEQKCTSVSCCSFRTDIVTGFDEKLDTDAAGRRSNCKTVWVAAINREQTLKLTANNRDDLQILQFRWKKLRRLLYHQATYIHRIPFYCYLSIRCTWYVDILVIFKILFIEHAWWDWCHK